MDHDPHDDDSLDLVLEAPIRIGDGPGGIEHSVLHLTQPTVGQLREATKAGGALDQTARLIALNAKVPPAIVDRMVQRDFQRADDFFDRFNRKQTSA